MGGQNGQSGRTAADSFAWAAECPKTASTTLARPVGGFTKRSFDVTLIVAGFILLWPLLLLIALLVRSSGPGPVIYRHKRIGYGGREFSCLKFRTMSVDGERILEEHFRQFPDARKEWQESRKLRHDPRITRIGSFLRKSSLDELPQLLNILCGDMSLVGPRPVVRDELVMYGPSAAHYLRARPGLTGAWQISGRSDTTYSERIALDADYVLRWSFISDLNIVVRTVPAVVFASGSR
ncbi:sugar transferase [Microvirga terrae]|uniref:Sugar transferase n=1 Tax=Microvirga terrae TaxID=2740529 RepID=A0ABY5RQ37_9HYPH|nr:sugar transferase [Microvirga terrae]UVF18409.1 sugar transferase [Microvirga terrae]